MPINLPKHQPLLPSPISSPPPSLPPDHNQDPIRQDSLSTGQSRPITKESTMILLTTIQRCLSDLEGRDKMMKIIQYSFKVLLFHQWVDAKRWSAMVSHLSQTRKLLRVGKWIDTLLSQTTSYIVLGNRVADDLFCFYKLGVVGPGIGKKAERLAMYCWFLNICIDLKSTIMSLQQKKLFLTQLSCVKLVMDALFCACDIWKPTPGIQAWSGFFSGCLAGYKHWCTK